MYKIDKSTQKIIQGEKHMKRKLLALVMAAAMALVPATSAFADMSGETVKCIEPYDAGRALKNIVFSNFILRT